MTSGSALATVSVTVEPSRALPDDGDCESTVPGALAIVACLTTATLKPRL
jgi:hypothetical protein